MIPFHSLYITLKQDYLHFIHFHSFLFFNFKTSNQGYLILFHSINFPYLNTFHSIPFPYDNSIPFLYELTNEALTFPILDLSRFHLVQFFHGPKRKLDTPNLTPPHPIVIPKFHIKDVLYYYIVLFL